MSLHQDCSQCKNPMCQITIPRFHFKHPGKTSITPVDGRPAQNALLWDLFEFALVHCFQVQDFRVMLYYGLWEHNIPLFLRETDELPVETVISFLKLTHQVVIKMTRDFKKFYHEFSGITEITDLVPNIITILQMELLGLSSHYIRHHQQHPDFCYTLRDITG
ncbi:MAG: hypothetical protein HQM12_03950 [SAR324 cluster bacterium]|nr:hypothetical protein [SAR324 cluster bacterium]